MVETNVNFGELSQKLTELNELLRAALGAREGAEVGAIVPETEVTEDWQVYVVKVSLNPSEVKKETLTVSSHGHFDLVKIIGNPQSGYDVKIQDGNSNRYLSARAEWMPAEIIVGTPQLPYMLLGRRRFMANSTIVLEFRNRSTTDPIDIVFSLHGIKVFI